MPDSSGNIDIYQVCTKTSTSRSSDVIVEQCRYTKQKDVDVDNSSNSSTTDSTKCKKTKNFHKCLVNISNIEISNTINRFP